MASRGRCHDPKDDAGKQKERFRGKGPRGVSKWVTRDVLEGYFDRPLDTASKELGVSTTIVKRICRKLGVARWPYRQICSLDKSIAKLQQAILDTTSRSEIHKIQENIRYLQHQREGLVKDPMPLSPYTLPIRVPPARPGSSGATSWATAFVSLTQSDAVVASGATVAHGPAASGDGRGGGNDDGRPGGGWGNTNATGTDTHHARRIPISSSASRGRSRPKGLRCTLRYTGASSSTTTASRLKTHIKSTNIYRNSSTHNMPCVTPDMFSMSHSKQPIPAPSKRSIGEAWVEDHSSPRVRKAEVSSTSRASDSARTPPTSGPRKRLCSKRVTVKKSSVETPSTLPEILQAEQPASVARLPASSLPGTDRPEGVGSLMYLRDHESMNALFLKLRLQKQSQSRQRGATGGPHGNVCRGDTQYDPSAIARNTRGGEWASGYVTMASGGLGRLPSNRSRSCNAPLAVDMGILHAADSLHQQAIGIGKTGQCKGATGVMKMKTLQSASETTGSMGSGDDDRGRAHIGGTCWGSEFSRRANPVVRSAAAALECLAGVSENDMFPTSPLLESLWGTTQSGSAGANTSLNGMCLESPFELDIPNATCSSAATGSRSSSSNATGDSNWTSTASNHSASSFYCNDELVFTPSGLVGDGW